MNQYRSKRAGKNIIATYNQLLKEWGIPVEEMNLNTSFGVTHVITAGKETSAPLILFHGVGDDAALMWIYNAKALAKHYKIYAIDTIGGPGKSTMGEGYSQSYDDVVWIEEIMANLHLSKVSFAGVSHGGYLVQLFTLKRKDAVEKAICISSSVPCGKEGGSMKTMMKIFLPEALFPTRKNTLKLIRKLSGSNSEALTNNELFMEHNRWLLRGFNNMAMRYHKVHPFTDEEIAAIKDHVFYLVGEQDLFEQLGGKNALIEHDMNAHFYPDAGHGLNHENADEINEMMITIMDGKIHNIRNY